MKSITVIYDGTSYTYLWLKAILCLKTEFKKEGYVIEMTSIEDYYPVTRKLEQRIKNRSLKRDFDIVFLAFHHSLGWLGKCSTTERIEYLKAIRQKCNKLIWLDTADSTGSCMFDVLPYVDKYLKKQILNDFSLYTKPMYQNRIFSDYYHKSTNLCDEIVEDTRPLLDISFSNKLGVAWNLCLGDIFRNFKMVLMDTLHIHTPVFYYNTYYNREFDIHFRGSLNYSNTIGYQRKKIAELLNKLEGVRHPDPSEIVSRKIFYKELSSSKALLSPFGWGEICFRDFEAFCYGTTLLKPSMKGILTYPNLYIENETYVPIDWDFNNLNEVIYNLNTEKYRFIAEKGQKIFKHSISEKGKKEFVHHLLSQID